MNIVTQITTWRQQRQQLHPKTVGFVHTMGALHAGHLSLCKQSQEQNDCTTVAIFINPTQFNCASDQANYPRMLQNDLALLREQKIDHLLLFNAESIYADHYQVRVSETRLSQILEGRCRPGHFTGMLTVVLKYLNLVQPTHAYYGEKDYQQLLLIKKMVRALFLPIKIVACPTQRAQDGLALSSRNVRLNDAQRKTAAQLPKLLRNARDCKQASEALATLGFKIDYVVERWKRRLAAVWLEQIRLIDNISQKECTFSEKSISKNTNNISL